MAKHVRVPALSAAVRVGVRACSTGAFLASQLVACAPKGPRAYGETVFFVDGDWPDSAGLDRLRIDAYAEDGRWFVTRELTDFVTSRPASFSVYSDDDGREKFVWVRFRAFPTGRLRDVPASGTPRLSRDGVDVTPPEEPDPTLAVDRLVVVRLRPGEQKQLALTLRGACAGVEAQLRAGDASMGPIGGQAASCVDSGPTREQVEESATSPRAPVAPDARLWGVAACPPDAAPPERVCIPGGPTILGAADVVILRGLDSTPERLVVLSRFAIDRDEVTVARWRAALAAGMSPPDPGPTANDGDLVITGGTPSDTQACTWSAAPLGREDFPLNCVTGAAARAFCNHFGGELPTEAQWEYAAALAGRARKAPFAWGDEPATCAHAVYGRAPDGVGGDNACVGFGLGPRPVSEYADLTPLGVRGMAGGLTEYTRDAAVAFGAPCWTQDAPRVDPSCIVPDARAVVSRGGAWAGGAMYVRTTQRYPVAPDRRSPILGFRCVYAAAGP